MPFSRPTLGKRKSGPRTTAAFRDVLDTEFLILGCICTHAWPDRGSDFTSDDFVSFCKEHGICVSYASTATPSHNGLIERSHRTAVEMTRALLFQARL